MLIHEGAENLRLGGAAPLTAFRAGNFGANRDTFDALAHNGIFIDSSYNLTSPLGPCLNETIFQPIMVGGIQEYPVTVFEDGFGRYRHLQIGANSYEEMSTVLKQAYDKNWGEVVLFWHSAELLSRDKAHYDAIATRRFTRLCDFLARNNSMFSTLHFTDSHTIRTPLQIDSRLRVTKLDTALRHGEQFVRRLRGA